LISDIRNSPKSKDVERIYLPGEIEWLNKQKRLAQGIPIPVNLQTEINDLAAELKVNARL
jgi:LDH2 family malate/lactate/ureidoglycolate dehydrogenase